MNVVFDTNIWVSYAISGKNTELVELITEYNLVVFSSEELINELNDVLNRKKFSKYILLPIKKYIDFHCSLTTFVSIESTYKNSPDPKDNFLFDLAFQTNSKYIITGDRALLKHDTENVRTIGLTDFKQLVRIL